MQPKVLLHFDGSATNELFRLQKHSTTNHVILAYGLTNSYFINLKFEQFCKTNLLLFLTTQPVLILMRKRTQMYNKKKIKLSIRVYRVESPKRVGFAY